MPISAISSSRLASPCVSAALPTEGEGGPPGPRAALAVLSRPRRRAEPRSSTQRASRPSSTMGAARAASPSASNGREPMTRGREGSSVTDRPAGSTASPMAPRSQDAPRATAEPLAAASRWPISEEATRS